MSVSGAPSFQRAHLLAGNQQRAVRDHVGVVRGERGAQVDDRDVGAPGGVQHVSDHFEGALLVDLLAEKAGQGAVSSHHVALEVHGDDRGLGRVEFHGLLLSGSASAARVLPHIAQG